MSITRGTSALVALTAAAALTAVAYAPAADAGPSASSGCTSAKTHHLGRKASGGRITLLPGQCVQISLVTASDGGYAWHTTAQPDRSVVTRVSAREIPPSGSKGTVGGYSTTVYLFKRVGRGDTELRLREEQTGRLQKDDPTFRLTIRGR